LVQRGELIMPPIFPRFTGNCPHNVAKDAKYTVRSGQKGPVAALTYRSSDGERWYASNEEHPRLLAMVNEVKVSMGGAPNGAFYINEYKQVIVPVVGNTDYYLAGTYDGALRFNFEGNILSGEAVDLEGNLLSSGDTWVGPRPGIPYTLCAGGKDIRYTVSPRANVTREVLLSKAIGRDDAVKVASRVAAFKGYAGGRFYINEWRVIFAPMAQGSDWQYVYIGRLDSSEPWFPISQP
jgi:hypothetical protein